MLNAVRYTWDGEFEKMLSCPITKVSNKRLAEGWEEVRTILLREHPDFEVTRQKIAEKYRK